jgi:hypothetical protein
LQNTKLDKKQLKKTYAAIGLAAATARASNSVVRIDPIFFSLSGIIEL